MKSFSEGLDCIQVFERWSKHDELTPYASALEEWDDLVGEDWEEPDTNYLTPYSCISENEVFLSQNEKVRDIIHSSFQKSEGFLKTFQEYLQIFWKNKQYTILKELL